ncbi:hypothetical protein N658DRAFT_532666 [Parathielavia hyrcaniae]|uniref:Uncharacterized protein n=1 Tax=Parathielavia hyrcaniae TaxID=113614 RepID=A0AAN6SWL8_9PEZI|nr:hypothetical protein N658DRAFT_532666 [Parathielavia hyrcaniae]
MEGTHAASEQLPIHTLNTTARDITVHAINNVLSSEIAKQTYAQIVDRLPLAHVSLDRFYEHICSDHPLRVEHKELSSIFSARLVELVARAVHQIAVWLYQQDRSRHKDDAFRRWRPSESRERFYLPTFPATLFCHPWYRDYDQYPESIADCVGYWAEARILGSVVLFDRRDPEPTKKASEYAMSSTASAAFSTARWTNWSRSSSPTRTRLGLGLGHNFPSSQHSGSRSCPLPILPSQGNRQRVDLEQDIQATGIYRDPWERRLRPVAAGDLRTRDVVDEFNYLSIENYQKGRRRAERERWKRVFGDLRDECRAVGFFVSSK